ncbi:DUF3253 domain-containing protein [Aureimonas sp. AU4]|uniref:DUF3253 domain-containing protein n=1 Tax=Aureimonas sp. AU4 TaxID=1638163 RepID=UPI00078576C6|nr:DUF3253 domain-containing protein [Aureimonas sp. AU4]
MSKEVRRQILTMLAEQPGQAIDPAEVARALAGNDEKRWRLLMTPIRREAVKLAEAGRVELRRKGQRIDPAELRGIYRIAKAVPAGEGNSASVFPVSL